VRKRRRGTCICLGGESYSKPENKSRRQGGKRGKTKEGRIEAKERKNLDQQRMMRKDRWVGGRRDPPLLVRKKDGRVGGNILKGEKIKQTRDGGGGGREGGSQMLLAFSARSWASRSEASLQVHCWNLIVLKLIKKGAKKTLVKKGKEEDDKETTGPAIHFNGKGPHHFRSKRSILKRGHMI